MNFEVNFRFLKLNKFQAVTLEREVPHSCFQQDTETSHFIGITQLKEEDGFEDLIIFFERQKVRLEDCGIFVSVAGNAASASIEVPFIVNTLLKHINCQLVFSYKTVSEEN